MSGPGTHDEASLAVRVQKEVERAIQRNIKGAEFCLRRRRRNRWA